MKLKNSGAFTLIEILIVVTIIMTLVAVFGTRLFRTGARANVMITKTSMENFKNGELTQYSLDVGHYPKTSEGGLQALITRPTDPQVRANWQGPYMDKLPTDAWKNEYEYNSPPVRHKDRGWKLELISYGANGMEGGDGADADIVVGL